MDAEQLSRIFQGASLMCMCIALLRIWCDRFQAASRTNVAGKFAIEIECDGTQASETLRRLTADAERLNREIERALKAGPKLQALPAKTPKQTGRKPPRELPPTPPPMQDERFRAPAKKRSKRQ